MGQRLGRTLNPLLAFAVDARCGFVQHQDVGVAEIGTNEGNELSLSHTQRRSPLTNVVVKAFRQPLHKLLCAHLPDGFPDAVVVDGLVVKSDVFTQRTAEQENVLKDHTDLGAKDIDRNVANVHSVNGDAAFLVLVEPRNQVDNRALSRPSGPDKGHALTRLNDKTHAAEHPLWCAVRLVHVGEPHVVEHNFPFPTRDLRNRRIGDAVVSVEQLEHPIGIDNAHLQDIETVGQLSNGSVQHEHVKDELKHHTKCQLPFHHMSDAQPQKQCDTCCAEHFHHGEEHAERPN